MNRIIKLTIVALLVFSIGFLSFSSVRKNKTDKVYSCLPCGYDCDKQTFSQPGKCPSCQMDLVDKSTIRFKTIQPSALCAYIAKHPATVLLDVRTKEEFEGKADPNFGTLKNAINIPIQGFETKLSSISNLKNKEIIVYCSHSHRSPQVSYMLMQNGFTKIINMEGGMSVMTDKSCVK